MSGYILVGTKCSAVTKSGAPCSKNALHTLKSITSGENLYVHVCSDHQRQYLRTNKWELQTQDIQTKGGIYGSKHLSEEHVAEQAYVDRIHVNRGRRNPQDRTLKQYSALEMQQQLVAARGVRRPAFLSDTQFKEILETIEREGLPKGNRVVVIDLAVQKGFLKKDNNYQSKVEAYMLTDYDDAATDSDNEEEEQMLKLMAGWKRQVQQMEGSSKNYTQRRLFNAVNRRFRRIKKQKRN